MLIDGNSLAYRAFYALPTSMSTASGQVTNAVFGFTSMLINLWRDHSPDRIVVAFDRPEPTFRHERVPTYKANRRSTPGILVQQMGLVREIIDALGVPTAEAVRHEADDVIATLAAEGRDAGEEVIIVSGDRDVYQLVEDPLIRVLYNRRGVSDYVLYDEAGILERTGVRPADYVTYAALRGDASDNLPGVPGVGEKTAARLVNERGGLDGIFSVLDELTPRLRQNLAAAETRVRSNSEMMRLVSDAPLEAGLDDLEMHGSNPEAVRKLFDFLELRSLHERLAEIPGGVFGDLTAFEETASVVELNLTVCSARDEATGLLKRLAGEGRPLALAVPPGGLDEGLALVADSDAGEVAFVPGPFLEASHGDVLEALARLVGRGQGNAGRPLAVHGAKPVMKQLLERGIGMRDPYLDTRLAAYLLDPADTRYDLSDLLRRHTGVSLPSRAAAEGQLDFAGDSADVACEAGEAALATDRLVAPLREALAAQGLADLNDNVEVPLVRVLTRMEQIGIGVDRGVLTRIRDELRDATSVMRDQVIADAGREFNVNSPKQLGKVLFDDLGLTPLRRTKTGYSTDARSLERLRGDHPIVDHLLEYRALEKLRSTYGEGLLAEVEKGKHPDENPDSSRMEGQGERGVVGSGERIRATFNQTVARTGRLSSDAPNLHNIPVRSERGRVFRTAFAAPEGCRLLVADYDQIELRCIAHLADDPGLIAAFEAGDDIHTSTAALVFGSDPGTVTVEERSKAKMVAYGLAYGMEAYGLGQRLNIATSEAAEILDAYFEAFPAVRQYMHRTVEQARRRGYTETLFGRRRQIPELASRNSRIRQAGERQAMNAGIQGLAADIFKVALVRLDGELERGDLRSRIVLQVHDEIILESPEAEIDASSKLILEVMSGAFELRVPLEVDLRVARTWADAKG